MIIDTLVVIVLMVDTPRQVNRMDTLFQKADSAFSKAMDGALKKTKPQRDKILSMADIETIVQELKCKTIKP